MWSGNSLPTFRMTYCLYFKGRREDHISNQREANSKDTVTIHPEYGGNIFLRNARVLPDYTASHPLICDSLQFVKYYSRNMWGWSPIRSVCSREMIPPSGLCTDWNHGLQMNDFVQYSRQYRTLPAIGCEPRILCRNVRTTCATGLDYMQLQPSFPQLH
jgi:hypothetical protein